MVPPIIIVGLNSRLLLLEIFLESLKISLLNNRFATDMVVDLNSFVSKRPFFANKTITVANLSRIHRRVLFFFFIS